MRHALLGAEQVGQQRDIDNRRLFEQQRRSTGAQHPVGDFGDFQIGIDRASIRFSSPCCSSWAMKSRRSRYAIYQILMPWNLALDALRQFPC